MHLLESLSLAVHFAHQSHYLIPLVLCHYSRTLSELKANQHRFTISENHDEKSQLKHVIFETLSKIQLGVACNLPGDFTKIHHKNSHTLKTIHTTHLPTHPVRGISSAEIQHTALWPKRFASLFAGTLKLHSLQLEKCLSLLTSFFLFGSAKLISVVDTWV